MFFFKYPTYTLGRISLRFLRETGRKNSYIMGIISFLRESFVVVASRKKVLIISAHSSKRQTSIQSLSWVFNVNLVVDKP